MAQQHRRIQVVSLGVVAKPISAICIKKPAAQINTVLHHIMYWCCMNWSQLTRYKPFCKDTGSNLYEKYQYSISLAFI